MLNASYMKRMLRGKGSTSRYYQAIGSAPAMETKRMMYSDLYGNVKLSKDSSCGSDAVRTNSRTRRTSRIGVHVKTAVRKKCYVQLDQQRS